MRQPTSLTEGQVPIFLQYVDDDLNVQACTLVEIVVAMLKDYLITSECWNWQLLEAMLS